jgi:hypothetical protein
VRSAARVQVERARRDPESVDLANELFGDLNAEPRQASTPAESEEAEREAKAAMLDSLGPPSDPKPLTPQERSLSEKIPSIEDLVNEVTSAGEAPFARGNGGDSAAGVIDVAGALPRHEAPLSLALSQPPLTAAKELETFRPPAAKPASTPLMPFLGALLFVAAAVAAFLFFRASHPEVAPPPSAAVVAQTETNAPTAPPAAAPTTANALPPTAAPSQAAAVALVEVNVTSEPRGAELMSDGKAAGTTPATLPLPAGVAVELRVHSAGYATKTEHVTPQAGMAPRHFALEPLPFELAITTAPAGATVRVKNASAVSPAPLALGHIDGMVNATIEKDGYQRMSRNVRLDEFHEQDGTMRADVSVSLTPMPNAPRRHAGRALPPPPEPPAPASASAAEPVIQVKAEPSTEEKPSEPAAPTPKAEAPAPAPDAPPAPSP